MATSEQVVAESIRDVLTASRWSRALFTTYSLSVAFFEGFLLPKLEDVGCGEIYVLVDERFYLQSLSERQSYSVGKSYRLYPVRYSGSGIFHPKVTYLWGDEYDLLGVGSGNLTYAGHGSNLECLDFASSQREPGVFIDFADFLGDLTQSSRAELGDCRNVLTEFATRAAVRGQLWRGEANRPRIMHSIRESIGSQLVRALKDRGQCRRLVCVSPYHHPQGEAVIDLCKALGVKRLDVCLDPNGLRAPFTKGTITSRGLQARFVVPEDKDSRPLHAKWYEFWGQENFLLTGSVNATHTSLWSTDNIEVALLRPVSDRAGGKWIEKEPKRVEAPEFFQVERIYDGIATAVLGEDGFLRGKVSGLKRPAGRWVAEIVTMLGRTSLGEVEVGETGAFVLAVPDEVQEVEGSVQLRLRRGKEIVAGWIELTVYLDDETETRGARLALARLSRGEGVTGDVGQVVHWLTTFIEGGEAARKPGSTKPGDSEHEFEDRQITYDEFISESSNPRRGGSSLSNLVRRALTSLIKGKEAAARAREIGGEAGDGLPDDSGPKTVVLEEFDVISTLIRVINRALFLQPQNPIGIELALFKAEYGLRSAIGTDLAQALPARAMEWVGWVAGIAFPSSRKLLLEPVVVAMAGCAAQMAPPSHSAAWTSELRETLRKYVSKWSLDEMKVQAAKGLEHRIFRAINPEVRNDFLRGLDAIWNARTYLDELKAFVEGIRAGQRPKVSPVLEQTLGANLLKALWENARNSNQKFFEVGDPRKVTGCPGCGLSIDSSERVELRRRRAVRCRGCSKAILWLGA